MCRWLIDPKGTNGVILGKGFRERVRERMCSHLSFFFLINVLFGGSHRAQISLLYLVVEDGLKLLALVPRVRLLACAPCLASQD